MNFIWFLSKFNHHTLIQIFILWSLLMSFINLGILLTIINSWILAILDYFLFILTLIDVWILFIERQFILLQRNLWSSDKFLLIIFAYKLLLGIFSFQNVLFMISIVVFDYRVLVWVLSFIFWEFTGRIWTTGNRFISLKRWHFALF